MKKLWKKMINQHYSWFSRLTILVLLSVIFMFTGGIFVSQIPDLNSCSSWPICFPNGYSGYALLLHRVSIVFGGISIFSLLIQSWRTQRDNRILLPLSTISVLLFFCQIFIGAMEVIRGFLPIFLIIHKITAIALIVNLLLLLVAANFVEQESAGFPPINIFQRVKDIISLTKPIIVLLLLVTTYAGMVAGGHGFPAPAAAAWTLIGGALAAGGSGAINQYIDRNLDKNMQRTSKRPLPSGRMTAAEGLSIGLAMCVLSFYIMVGFVNIVSAILSLAGIVYYVFLYSIWLKKITIQNIVIGGGAGAIPPLVGWAAATGGLDINALVLFLIIFLWTPPHFWALAIVRRKDYEKAGVPMMPVIKGEQETRKQVWFYTILLVAASLLLPILRFTGYVYLFSSIILGLFLLYFAWKVLKTEGNKSAWLMYRFSSMYLLLLFFSLIIDTII